MRCVNVLGIILIWSFSSAFSANVLGSWDVTAKTASGETYYLDLNLEELDGKLSGNLVTPEGTTPIEKAKLNGDVLSFQVWADSSSYTVELMVTGNRMTGTFEGSGGAGTLDLVRKE